MMQAPAATRPLPCVRAPVGFAPLRRHTVQTHTFKTRRDVRASVERTDRDAAKAPGAPPTKGRPAPVDPASVAAPETDNAAPTATDRSEEGAVPLAPTPEKEAAVAQAAGPETTSALPPAPRPHKHRGLGIGKKRSWSAILWDQVIDSVDDILTHLKRQIQELPTTTALQRLTRRGGRPVLPTKKPVVLVLGSGWGAHAAIKVLDTDAFEVICISKTNHFLFTPMLPSTAIGTVEFRSLLEPIRTANPFVAYAEAVVDAVDLGRQVASCTSVVADSAGRRPTFEVPYDTLLVAVGERTASFGVPGVREHCYFMKEVADAVALRRRIQEVFELAALPGTSEEQARLLLHFVVVGGGPTGVEFAGTLSDFLRQDLRRKYPELVKSVQVTLLQSAQSILTQFDQRLAKRALDNFKATGVEVRTGVSVTEVAAEAVVLSTGERLECGLCVWSAGNSPQPLIQGIAEQIPEQAAHYGPSGKPSKLAVDPFLRVVGAKDVLALGDCSMLAERLPPTAQVAGQQGAYAAHLINRRYQLGTGGSDAMPPWKLAAGLSLADRVFGSVTDTLVESTDEEKQAVVLYKKPFEFLSLGILASIGNEKAVAEVEIFDIKLPVWGNPAFLLWKSVYITKQVSFRNRVKILFDWLSSRVFGRDLSQF